MNRGINNFTDTLVINYALLTAMCSLCDKIHILHVTQRRLNKDSVTS